MLTRGTVIGGSYRIVDVLAHGGMSRVYLAESVRTGIPWVIKEVRDETSFSQAFLRESLLKEIHTLKDLEHPSLVRVVDALVHESRLLMVMEYVQGRTLQQVLRDEGMLSEQRTVRIAEQICDALGYLHSRGKRIIYRDLKPSNIMIRPDGRAVLIDFGTVHLAGEKKKIAIGTPGFAAPEQVTGKGRIDEATDVYALGRTLCAMLTGGKPEGMPGRRISRQMRGILKRCTSYNAKKRYRHVAEVHYALTHLQETGLEAQMIRVSRLLVFLMFFIPAVVFVLRFLTGGRSYALSASVLSLLSLLVFWRAGVKEAFCGLFGWNVRAGVERRLRSQEVNGVFMIGRDMITKDVVSWQDVELPLDDPMTDVRIDFDRGKVKFIVMNGFTLERDIMVTLRENYRVVT
ncbi:MAG: serine/threonine protein kinase [Lachnospiraceae bacterium]|nr:serine/threonine protein kinase [Lachnospiraceae bacterium]